jgi:hypothetical protein
MNDELSRVIERVRQNRAALARDGLTANRSDTRAATSGDGAIIAGSPAFDRLTGEVVEVLSVHRENVVRAAPER